MKIAGINGTGVALVSAGLVLAYSAIKGKSVGSVVRDLLGGKDVSQSANANQIADPNTTNPNTASATQQTSLGLLASGGNNSTIVLWARQELGKPYIFDTPLNANDPNPVSFDCSGLVMWCYNKVGVKLAHYAPSIYAELKHRPASSAQPGDVVFYQAFGGLIHHCAINIGNGQLIEAPDWGIPVRIRSWKPGDPEVMANVGYA